MFFFFTHSATTDIYTLSLHDALPIFLPNRINCAPRTTARDRGFAALATLHRLRRPNSIVAIGNDRSEEHTSELQSLRHLVCRLLLEKKKQQKNNTLTTNHNTLNLTTK